MTRFTARAVMLASLELPATEVQVAEIGLTPRCFLPKGNLVIFSHTYVTLYVVVGRDPASKHLFGCCQDQGR